MLKRANVEIFSSISRKKKNFKLGIAFGIFVAIDF